MNADHAGLPVRPRSSTVPRRLRAGSVVPTLSILVPVHDEETVVPLFMARIASVIDELRARYDVRLVFLDNYSTDHSNAAIQTIMRERPDVYVVRMSQNVGYQKSLDTGLRVVESDLYAYIDVDGEDPPEMLLRFAAAIEAGHDLAYGIRTDRPEPGHIKRMRRTFYRVLNRMSDEHSLFLMAEFSMFRRDVRDAAIAETNSFPFVRSNLARVGFDRIGLPYVRQPRIAGKTHYRLVGMTVFAVAGILASTTLPLRWPIYALPLWLMLVTLCGVLAVAQTSAWWALAAFLLTAGFLGASVSIVALYVARTYKNSFARPNAHIQHGQSRLPPVEAA